MTAILPIWSLFLREVLRFYRQRSRIIGTLGAPFLFWIFLGAGLGSAFPPMSGGQSYLKFFFPGNLILAILFTSIFSSISLIEDRREGFLQGVLISPASDLSLVTGKILGGAFLALFQGTCFLLLAPSAGFSLTASGMLLLMGAMMVTSFTMSAIGFFFAWKFDSIQGFHSVMNLLLFPMWLLSGAFFPAANAPLWVRVIMTANPLTYGLEAMRMGLTGSFLYPFAAVMDLFAVALFGAVFFLAAQWQMKRGRRK